MRFTIGPRAVSVLLLCSIISIAVVACTAAQKAAATKVLTGHTDPASTQPAGGIEGATASVGATAGVVGDATAGTPIGGIMQIIAGVAGALLVLERLAVRGIALLPNSQGSPSDSNSTSATASGGAGAGAGPGSNGPATTPVTAPILSIRAQ